MDESLKPALHKLWNYMNIDGVTEPADLIIAFGTSDTGLAVRAAELYHQGLAPNILFAGNRGARSTHSESESEAGIYKRVALLHGVPEKDIYTEPRSTNSEENTKLSYELVQKENLPADSIILIQKPVSLRRFRATFKKFWPNKNVRLQMSCEQTTPEEYLIENPDGHRRINQMMGDFQRLHVYAEGNYTNYRDLFRDKDWEHINETDGFSVTEEIPDDVWEAWETLKSAGYNETLVEQYRD